MTNARPNIICRNSRNATRCASLLLTLVLSGCASSPQPTTRPSSWADQARKDPMNYNPNMEDWPTVSGGGLSHFDKQEFNQDVNHVLNP